MTKNSHRLRKRLGEIGHFGMASVPVLGFVVFGLFPMAMSLIFSFTDVSLSLKEEFGYVGWNNFKYIFSDPTFYKSLFSTFIFSLSVPLTLVVSLYIAYLVEKVSAGKRFFRLIFFIPYVCSTVAMSLVWKQMFDTHYGILNTFLGTLGLSPIAWISSKEMIMVSCIIMSVWSGMGFCVIMFQAALANVNKSYYEAARLDGASEREIFFKITLPAVSPTTFYLLVMRLIGSLQVFTEPQILAGGSLGLDNWDMTVVRYIMKCINGGWGTLGLGVGSAAGWVITLVIVVITWLNFRMGDKWTNYDMS